MTRNPPRWTAALVTVLAVSTLALLAWVWPRTEYDLYQTAWRWGLAFHVDANLWFALFFGTIVAILVALGALAMMASYMDRIPYSVFIFIACELSCGFF